MALRRKGWFRIEGVQDGDRTLAQQLRGLGAIDFQDKSVLDLGCAEGLIAQYALLNGAQLVDGVEIIAANVDEARRQCAELGDRARFWQMDLARFDARELRPHYDIVLMLAILHKLRRPLGLLEQIALLKADLCVVRLPGGSAGVVNDERSGRVPYDVLGWFAHNGYEFERQSSGYLDEWVGYFRRHR